MFLCIFVHGVGEKYQGETRRRVFALIIMVRFTTEGKEVHILVLSEIDGRWHYNMKCNVVK